MKLNIKMMTTTLATLAFITSLSVPASAGQQKKKRTGLKTGRVYHAGPQERDFLDKKVITNNSEASPLKQWEQKRFGSEAETLAMLGSINKINPLSQKQESLSKVSANLEKSQTDAIASRLSETLTRFEPIVATSTVAR